MGAGQSIPLYAFFIILTFIVYSVNICRTCKFFFGLYAIYNVIILGISQTGMGEGFFPISLYNFGCFGYNIRAILWK